jgi:phenylacetate-CoA ligase
MEWGKICRLSTADIKALQEYKMKRMVRYLLPFHPFYGRVFEKEKINYKSIKTLEDFARLPFSSKKDIAPTADNPSRPQDFILQPTEELIKKHWPKYRLAKILFQKFVDPKSLEKQLKWEFAPVHLIFTAGRTALPTPFAYSKHDLELLAEGGARMMDVLKVSDKERAINAFPYVPHLAFYQALFGLIEAGLLSLQTGGGKSMGTEKILDALVSLKASILIAIPGYAYHLVSRAVEEKRDLSAVNLILMGGERVPPGLREKLKEMLALRGAKKPRALNTYAFTEGKIAWVQCHEKSGYHLYPDLELIEIVDDKGNPVPDGERGEIVYTALDWRGTMVVRYKTNDTGKFIPGPCKYCSRTVPILDPDIQRKSEIKEFNLTKIKGTLVNLNLLFPILMGHKDVDEWQIELRKKDGDPLGLDEFVIYVAPRAKADFGKVSAELRKMIFNETEVTPEIIKIDRAKLLERLGMETELKEKRIIDIRPK